LGKKSTLESNPDNLPSVDTIPDANYGIRVVQVLKYSDNKLAPIVYAYNLWRRFPDDIIAQRELIFSTVFICGKNKSVLPEPTSVDAVVL